MTIISTFKFLFICGCRLHDGDQLVIMQRSISDCERVVVWFDLKFWCGVRLNFFSINHNFSRHPLCHVSTSVNCCERSEFLTIVRTTNTFVSREKNY